MTDRKQKILQMLEAGIINKEQADQLIATIEEEQCVNHDFDSKMSKFNERFAREKVDSQRAQLNMQWQLVNNEIAKRHEEVANLHKQYTGDISDEMSDHLDELVEQVEDQIEELEDTLDEIEDQIDECNDISDELNDAESDLADLEADMRDLERDMKELGEQMRVKSKEFSKKINASMSGLGKELQDAFKGINVVEPLGAIAESLGKEVSEAFANVKGNININTGKDTHIHVNGGCTITRTPNHKSTKDFDDCKIIVKYLKGAFRYNGDFATTKSGDFKSALEPFVSARAFDEISKLMDQKYQGDYKFICGDEILKVVIE